MMKAVLVLVLAGCSPLALGAADRGSLESATLVEVCPLGVPWTRVSTAANDAGIDVVFTNVEASRVDELRQRVRDQARAYGPGHHQGPGHEGGHNGPENHGLRLWSMGEIATTVSDTAGGATITVVPADPTRRDEVRRLVAKRVDELTSNGCRK